MRKTQAGAAPPPRHREGDNAGSGIALTLGFTAIAPLMESTAKVLGETTAATQITWFRFVTHIVLIGGYIFLFLPRSDWRPRPLWPLLARGLLTTFGAVFVYAGLAAMPMVDAVSIFFTQPLILTALSALLLKERVGLRRWLAVLAGMTGAMLIIGPNFSQIGWAATLPALAALSHAGAGLMARRWAGIARLPVFQFYTAVVAAGATSLALFAGWQLGIGQFAPRVPSGIELTLLLVIGVGSIGSNLMLTQAYRIAPTSIIAPFLYVHIIGSTVMGYLIFAHLPTARTLIGAALVIFAGMFVWWRETRRHA